MAQLHEDLAAVRDDVAYIRAKIEVLPDHEERLRSLEKRWWQFPASGVLALIGVLVNHIR